MPPMGRRRTLRSGRAWERLGYRVWPRLAGVHIVEATKALYVPAPAGKLRRALLRPAMANGAQSRARLQRAAYPRRQTSATRVVLEWGETHDCRARPPVRASRGPRITPAGIHDPLTRHSIVMLANAGIQEPYQETGFREFSNEVQHQLRVLRSERSTISCRWKNAVKLPASARMNGSNYSTPPNPKRS